MHNVLPIVVCVGYSYKKRRVMVTIKNIVTALLLVPSIVFAQLSTEHAIKAGAETLKEGVVFEVKNKGKYPIEVMVKQLPIYQ